jgi:cytochrome c peroxidase
MALLAALSQAIPVEQPMAPGKPEAPFGPSVPATAEPMEPVPLEPAFDAARAAIGETLFGDSRLSGDASRSCAACHPLDHGGMDASARANARGNLRSLRNTPTVFNASLSLFLTWDGAFESLSALDEKVLLDPAIMGGQWPVVLGRLGADRSLVARFRAAYGRAPDRESVLDALEQFERSLTTPNARFDRYLRGDATALGPEELEGFRLFKAFGCVSCHQGVNVGGNLLEKFGVFRDPARAYPAAAPDEGRMRWTRDPLDREVFRVPSLRNVALTAPYFHDGRAATLERAIETMARAQLDREPEARDVERISRFLHTLTGEFRGQPLQVEEKH